MSLQTHSIITINQQNESSLHDKFSKEDIEDLHSYFRECKNSVDRDALRKLLGYYNLFFTEDQFENLFLKV